MFVQEKTTIKIRTYYQNKLNTLKRILDIYQEKVVRKNSFWEEKVKVSHKHHHSISSSCPKFRIKPMM